MVYTTTYYDLSFASGDDVRPGFVDVLASCDQLDPDVEFTDLSGFFLDDWGWGGSGGMLKGIRATSCASRLRRGEPSWVIGEWGEVWSFSGLDLLSKGYLPDSGLEGRGLGRPNEIRWIAGRLYVCGFAGQVYTQDAKGTWVHMDDGLAEPTGRPDSIDLESIDGTAADDIYVVGSGGLMAHWDGRGWKRIELLTNVYLARVRCLAGRIFAVGNKGVFVEGDGKGRWLESHLPGEAQTSLSDVAFYEGDVYVAAGKHLYRRPLNGKDWEQVRHGLDPEKTTFLRLVVGEGRLWAMGFKRLNSFDGKQWYAHPDPNNK